MFGACIKIKFNSIFANSSIVCDRFSYLSVGNCFGRASFVIFLDKLLHWSEVVLQQYFNYIFISRLIKKKLGTEFFFDYSALVLILQLKGRHNSKSQWDKKNLSVTFFKQNHSSPTWPLSAKGNIIAFNILVGMKYKPHNFRKIATTRILL